MDVEIVDRAGLPLTGETIGELAVSGPFMMAGYLNNPQETANVTLGRFLRTGDEISRDADGMHFFRGRLKEVIRRGGENIAPFEVEAVIRSHPAVHDVAVVPVPDDLRGEEGKAYVEFTGVERVDFSELVNFCTERLAPHKIPRYYELRDRPFPRTPSQRIRKAQLKVAGVHALDDVWDRTEMRVQ